MIVIVDNCFEFVIGVLSVCGARFGATLLAKFVCFFFLFLFRAERAGVERRLNQLLPTIKRVSYCFDTPIYYRYYEDTLLILVQKSHSVSSAIDNTFFFLSLIDVRLWRAVASCERVGACLTCRCDALARCFVINDDDLIDNCRWWWCGAKASLARACHTRCDFVEIIFFLVCACCATVPITKRIHRAFL
jgi:hypothetical protein